MDDFNILEGGQPALIPHQTCPECGAEVEFITMYSSATLNSVLAQPCKHEITLGVSRSGLRVKPFDPLDPRGE